MQNTKPTARTDDAPQQVADPSVDRVSHGPAILAMHGVDSPVSGNVGRLARRRLVPVCQPCASPLRSRAVTGPAGPAPALWPCARTTPACSRSLVFLSCEDTATR